MTTSTAPVRRTQKERRDQAERSLLDSAARLFARKGVESTSLADIGREAGYSRGLANHHFDSRSNLMERLAARSQRRFITSMRPQASGIEAILGLAEDYLDALRDREKAQSFLVMWGCAFAEDSPLREVFATDDARFRKGIRVLVGQAQEAGEVSSDVDATAFSVTLVGMLRGIGAQLMVSPDDIDLDSVRRSCKELVRVYLDSDLGELSTNKEANKEATRKKQRETSR